MKFITLVETLKKAVNLAERITGRNLTLPVLNNILIATEKNEIKISATDLEIGIELTIGGKVEKEGKVVIPAKILAAFLNNLSEERITLEEEKQNLKIISGNYEAIFQGINPDDFPIIPDVRTDKYIEIEKNVFKETVGQILPTISYVSSRPELNGMLLRLEKNILKMVGTDSFRLGEKTITEDNFKTNIKDEMEMIIPLKTIQEIFRINQEDMELATIKIHPEPNQVEFLFKNIEGVRVISRLINGQYPEYSSIIPKEFENKIVFSKKDLIEIVKISGLFSGRINDIKFKLDADKKVINIEAQDPSSGKSQSSIKPKEIIGNKLEISFNYRFILDGLSSIKDEGVFVGLNKENNPGVFRGEKGDGFLYILMPIKI